ncbi:MAG TPA: copper homeostasis protein CutC [Bacteroidia bacterium]|jgi:copper homeostasis protein
MNDLKLEIACFNLESALIAQQGGADRIELCDGFDLGGITPAYNTFELARKDISVDLFVMIRPRGGNFVYSDVEFEQMKNDVFRFKEMNADGFVFGLLNDDGSIDSSRNKELITAAGTLPCTFHRAFDAANGLEKTLEDVIDCGFRCILTSGQKKSALEGIDQLDELITLAKERIEIMPGGGVRSSNIQLLIEKARTSFYHSSAIVKGDIADLQEIRLLKKLLKD